MNPLFTTNACLKSPMFPPLPLRCSNLPLLSHRPYPKFHLLKVEGHVTMSRTWLNGLALVFLSQSAFSMSLFNSTDLSSLLEKYADENLAKPRGKRAIGAIDKQAILDLHNKLRGQVYPPASNMEYMVRKSSVDIKVSIVRFKSLPCID